jgi:hypothetical protein
MLYIRKHKPTINKQTEGELFTLIIRNVKLETSMERDVQKYLNKKTKNKKQKFQKITPLQIKTLGSYFIIYSFHTYI